MAREKRRGKGSAVRGRREAGWSGGERTRTDGGGIRSKAAVGRVSRQAGGVNMGPLGRDVPEYGTGCRRRGGRTETDPFQDIQYPE